MSAPESIQWQLDKYGVTTPLRMGGYRLAADPVTAMNNLYATTPPGAPLGEIAEPGIRPVEFMPSPGTFV